MFKHGFPEHWSTLKKFVWLVGTGIIGGASYIWKTVTGSLIHITDALASPVKELSVAIDAEIGATGCNIVRSGNNLYGGIQFYHDWNIRYSSTLDTDAKTFSFAYNTPQQTTTPIPANFKFKTGTRYTFIITLKNTSAARSNFQIYYTDNTTSTFPDLSGTNVKQTLVVTSTAGKTVRSLIKRQQGGTTVIYYDECGIFEGVVSASAFETYVGTTHPISWQTEVGSITSGTLTIDENGGVTLVSGGNTYNLTGVTSITLFAGENNIWADVNGNITLTYQAVPKTAFSDEADTGMADFMTLTE